MLSLLVETNGSEKGYRENVDLKFLLVREGDQLIRIVLSANPLY
jgi:hypothetical protein